MSAAFWTTERDAALLVGVAEKMKFGAIGERLGITKSAAIARYHKLIGTAFASNQAREAERMIRIAKRNLIKAGAQ